MFSLQLVMIDTSEASFASDLKSFDLMPTRNHDTVFIFYLKARQTEKEEVNFFEIRCRCDTSILYIEMNCLELCGRFILMLTL